MLQKRHIASLEISLVGIDIEHHIHHKHLLLEQALFIKHQKSFLEDLLFRGAQYQAVESIHLKLVLVKQECIQQLCLLLDLGITIHQDSLIGIPGNSDANFPTDNFLGFFKSELH